MKFYFSINRLNIAFCKVGLVKIETWLNKKYKLLLLIFINQYCK
jgi:hypothetical protein